MQTATTSWSNHLRSAIERLDLVKLEREYWDQDEFLFIPEFLPPDAIAPLLEDVERLAPRTPSPTSG